MEARFPGFSERNGAFFPSKLGPRAKDLAVNHGSQDWLLSFVFIYQYEAFSGCHSTSALVAGGGQEFDQPLVVITLKVGPILG